jgi:uncharacterized protein (TIGR03437 family)
MKIPLASAVLLGAFALQAQQPYINYRGVVNAASYTPPGLSGSEIAQGSIFSIFGSNLGPATLAQVSAFPLQITLAGVSVKVTQGSTSVDALPLIVTASQINAIMPSNTPLGPVSIWVTFTGATSNPVTATVATSSFGIFATNSGGFGPGILQNYIAANNQPINSLSATAAPGQVITLWGTGLGPVSADNVAPTAGDLSTPVEIFVGGQLASKLYSGRTPCCSGVDQIVFKVPAGAPTGCYVPVQIRTAGTTLSNSVSMAIQNGGGACSDPVNPLSAAFAKGGNVGVAILSQSVTYTDVDVSQPVEFTDDLGALSVRAAPGGSLFFNPSVSMPPVGSCGGYALSGNVPLFSVPDLFGGLGMELDAGPSIGISGTANVSIMRAGSTPLYAAVLGTNDPVFGASSLVINTSGSTTVSASGGVGVGKFQVEIPAAPPLDWTNRLQIGVVDRSQPLNVTWATGGLQNAFMVVAVSNYDLPSNAQRVFVCTANGGDGTFTIPAYVLGALPASRPNVGQSFGEVMLGVFPTQNVVSFMASGLSTGLAVEVVSSEKSVLFQ